MTEWGVVLVIIALFGLITPIVNLVYKSTKTETRLADAVDSLQASIKDITIDNKESHRRIWEKNDEQDNILAEHDKKLAEHEIKIDNIESNLSCKK